MLPYCMDLPMASTSFPIPLIVLQEARPRAETSTRMASLIVIGGIVKCEVLILAGSDGIVNEAECPQIQLVFYFISTTAFSPFLSSNSRSSRKSLLSRPI